MASKLVPPYLSDSLEALKKRGISKCIPCFVVTALECAVLAGIVLGLVHLINIHPTLGFTVLSVLCVIVMVCHSLICWKKRRDKRDDYIEKKG